MLIEISRDLILLILYKINRNIEMTHKHIILPQPMALVTVKGNQDKIYCVEKLNVFSMFAFFYLNKIVYEDAFVTIEPMKKSAKVPQNSKNKQKKSSFKQKASAIGVFCSSKITIKYNMNNTGQSFLFGHRSRTTRIGTNSSSAWPRPSIAKKTETSNEDKEEDVPMEGTMPFMFKNV